MSTLKQRIGILKKQLKEKGYNFDGKDLYGAKGTRFFREFLLNVEISTNSSMSTCCGIKELYDIGFEQAYRKSIKADIKLLALKCAILSEKLKVYQNKEDTYTRPGKGIIYVSNSTDPIIDKAFTALKEDFVKVKSVKNCSTGNQLYVYVGKY